MAFWRQPRQPSYIDSMPKLQWFRMFLGVTALAGFMAAGWYLIGRQRVEPPSLSVATVPQTQAVPPVTPPQTPAVAPARPAQTPAAAVPAAEPHLAIGIPMLPKTGQLPAAPPSNPARLVTGLPTPGVQPPTSPPDAVAPPPSPARAPAPPSQPRPHVATPRPATPPSPPASGLVRF